MRFVFWYLLIAAFCWPFAHGFAAIIAYGRALTFKRGVVHEALRIFFRDFFKVHCPWSWNVARTARLEDMQIFLGENGQDHERLGHITASDFVDPNKRELIAQNCYKRRLSYWLSGLWAFVWAPIILVFQLLSPI